MKKSVLVILTLLIFSFNLSITTFATNEKLDDNKVLMNQINDKIINLDSQILNLKNNMDKAQNEIDNNKSKIKNFESEIETTEIKIEKTEKGLEKSQTILSSRLRAMYKSGSYSGANYLAYIFESNGFSDMLNRAYALNKVVKADNKIISSLKNSKKSLEENIQSLKTKKSEISKLNEENINNFNKLQSDKKELEEKKSKFNSELKSVQAQIEKNEDRLISPYINVIKTSSSKNDLSNSIKNLKELLPQMSTSSIKNKINSFISKGNKKIKDIEKKEEEANKPKPNNNNNNNESNGSSTIENGQSNPKKTITMEATAYYGHGITATGTVPVRNPNGLSTVAVDPNVIPLGSKVYVSGYGYAIAADTGGVIKGNKIDLFVNNREEALSFGRRNVTVQIISYPGEF